MNVLMLASLLWRGWNGRDANPGMMDANDNMAVAGERNAPRSSSGNGSQPFHWSQIESTDYRTYVANLRRIGCPEATIRDIIAADVHSLYERQRAQIPKPEGSNLLPEKVELQAELSRLGREEAELIAILLDDNSNQTAAARVSAATRPVRPTRAGSSSAPELPLVFRGPTEGIELNRERSEVIGYLRQKFTEEVTADGLDVNNPACAERWRKAQRDSDDLLAGLLGGEFYLNYQLQTEGH